MRHKAEWYWKCEDCDIEFYDSYYKFCYECGRARPFTLRMKEINSIMASLDERDEVIARIESLERWRSYRFGVHEATEEEAREWSRYKPLE